MPDAERGEVLLERLIELYLAEGFLAFGMGDLAARLRCSRSSLYQVASSKEQIILTAVRRYFKRAAERIEERIQAEPDAGRRLQVYLAGVSDELAPASARFHADLADYPPARALYQDNTRRAAQRVQDLVAEGVTAGALRPVNARFVGAAVAEVMTAIQRGDVAAATGLTDAEAYRELVDLVLSGLAGLEVQHLGVPADRWAGLVDGDAAEVERLHLRQARGVREQRAVGVLDDVRAEGAGEDRTVLVEPDELLGEHREPALDRLPGEQPAEVRHAVRRRDRLRCGVREDRPGPGRARRDEQLEGREQRDEQQHRQHQRHGPPRPREVPC